MVVLPKTIALWLAQDAYKARSYEHEIELLNDVINLREDVIMRQDTIINACKVKSASFSSVLVECQELNKRNDLIITGLHKQVQKEVAGRKFWKTVAIIGPILVGTLMYTRQ